MIDAARLIMCSTTVLTDSLGVAASLVVDDAWQTTGKTIKSCWATDLVLHTYFINLAAEVPVGLMTEKTKADILQAYFAQP